MRSHAYDRLHANLQTMGLLTMERNLDGALELAAKGERSLTEILDGLVHEEVKARHTVSTETRLRLAGFPVRKTLEEFDYKAQPSIDPKMIEELTTMRFAHNAENVILLGPDGQEKSRTLQEANRAGDPPPFVGKSSSTRPRNPRRPAPPPTTEGTPSAHVGGVLSRDGGPRECPRNESGPTRRYLP